MHAWFDDSMGHSKWLKAKLHLVYSPLAVINEECHSSTRWQCQFQLATKILENSRIWGLEINVNTRKGHQSRERVKEPCFPKIHGIVVKMTPSAEMKSCLACTLFEMLSGSTSRSTTTIQTQNAIYQRIVASFTGRKSLQKRIAWGWVCWRCDILPLFSLKSRIAG